MRAVDLLAPGDLGTPTGGYLYDARILAGLEALGWQTAAHSLDASFPEPDAAALAAAAEVLAAIPTDHGVLVDGLALAGLTPLIERHALRPRLVALIHHPLADETGLDADQSRRLFEMERAALELVGTVVVTSAWTRRELGRFGVGAERIVVVEPGTDPAPLRRGSGHAGLGLLCVASVTARKGHATLVEALARIRDRPWRLCCVGSLTREPETAGRLRREIERAELGDRIELVGELAPDSLGPYYDAADLFVLASHLEGYGMAITEALARGLPVVSTTAGAIPDTLPPGAGRLVSAGDSRALAEALADLIDHPQKLAALAAGAAEARAGLPSWEAACRRFSRALAGALTE